MAGDMSLNGRFHSKKLLASDKGMANLVIPIIISLTFVGFGISFQYERIQQIKTLSRNLKARDLKAEIMKVRLILGSNHHCKANFNTMPMGASISTIDMDKIVFADLTDPEKKGDDLLWIDKQLGPLTIKKIQLKKLEPIYTDATTYKGTLEVVAADTMDSFTEGVRAYITLASDGSGTIIDCSLAEMVSASQTYEDFICDLLNKDSIYDPTSGTGCYKIPSTP